MEIVKKLDPTKVIVAWDSKTSVSKRRELYPNYKAGRVKPGEDFYVQIPLLEELINDLGWNFVEIDNYEADDIIGTIAKRFSIPTYIYTGDRDAYQLVDDTTTVCFTKKGVSDLLELTSENFKEIVGIYPKQIIDLKALMGDKSDNIPGVSGVGEKSAYKLLEEYGTLEGVYENIESIGGALNKKLVEKVRRVW
jgi:DNA polymerase-1